MQSASVKMRARRHRALAGRHDDRYFILVFPSRSSGPWHYYVFSVRVIRVDIERIPGDRGTRKLPEFTANVCRDRLRCQWHETFVRKGVSRKIHSAAQRASIFHDRFFDDIGVDFSVTKTRRHQSFSSY